MSDRALVYGLLEELGTLRDAATGPDVLQLLWRVGEELVPQTEREAEIVRGAAEFALSLPGDQAAHYSVRAIVAAARVLPSCIRVLEQSVAACASDDLLQAVAFELKPLVAIAPALLARCGELTVRAIERSDDGRGRHNLETWRHLYFERLGALFPLAPVETFALGVALIETELHRESRTLDPGESRAEEFKLLGSTAAIVTNDVSGWIRHSPGIASEVSDVLAKGALNDPKVAQMCCRPLPGLFWEVLLDSCAATADLDPLPWVQELLEAVPLLSSAATRHAAGRLLQKTAPGLTASQVTRIAAALDRVADADDAAELAAVLPRASLSDRLGKVVVSLPPGGSPFAQHQPEVSFRSGVVEPNDYLRQIGVDITRPDNAGVLAMCRPLEEFDQEFGNEAPALERALKILPDVHALFEALPASTCDQRVAQKAVDLLAGAADAALRCDQFQGPEAERLRPVITLAATHEHPPGGQSGYSAAGWSRPAPRIEGAAAVMAYARKCGIDAALAELIGKLSTDPCEAVRFQVFVRTNLLFDADRPRMWALFERWVAAEQESLRFLPGPLSRVFRSEPARASAILARLWSRTDLEEEEDIRTELSPLVAFLASVGDATAATVLSTIFREAERQPSVLGRVLADLRLGAVWLSDDDGRRAGALAFMRRVADRGHELVADPDLGRRKAGTTLLDEIVSQSVFSLEDPKGEPRAIEAAAARFFGEADLILQGVAAAPVEDFSAYMRARLLSLWMGHRPARAVVAAAALVETSPAARRGGRAQELIGALLDVDLAKFDSTESRNAAIAVATRAAPYAGALEPKLRAFAAQLARAG